jgi:hypothetical protein
MEIPSDDFWILITGNSVKFFPSLLNAPQLMKVLLINLEPLVDAPPK